MHVHVHDDVHCNSAPSVASSAHFDLVYPLLHVCVHVKESMHLLARLHPFGMFPECLTGNRKVLGSNPSWIQVLAGNDLALMFKFV